MTIWSYLELAVIMVLIFNLLLALTLLVRSRSLKKHTT
jgi:hypothetical protein